MMHSRSCRCSGRRRLMASSAVALVLAIMAHGNSANAAGDVCIVANTTISGAAASDEYCDLGAGESVTIQSGGALADTTPATSSLRVTGAAGSISNAGTITSTGDGINLAVGSGLSGNLVNSGTITAPGGLGIFGSNTTIAGNIINSGNIESGNMGLEIYTSTSGAIINGGDIDANSHGIYVYSSTANGNIENQEGATISSPGYGILVHATSTVNGSIINDGVIRTTGVRAIRIVNNSTITGSIINRGTIINTYNNSTGSAINTSGGVMLNGAIVNSGDISGYSGIFLEAGTSVAGGIQNQAGGTITGTLNSINVGGANTTTVTNAGVLEGGVVLGTSRLDITGNDARVVGNVSGGAGSVVDVQGDFTSEGTFTVDTMSIASGGNLKLGHAVTATSGMTNAGVVDVRDGTVALTGDFTQAAGGVLAMKVDSTTSHGILQVSGNVDLSGSGAIALTVAPDSTLVGGQTIPGVISAGGAINAPSLTVTDNSAILNFAGILNGQAIDVNVTADPLGDVLAGTSAAHADGDMLDAIDTILNSPAMVASSPVFGALTSLGSAAEVAAALNELQPALGGNAAQSQVMMVSAGSNRVTLDRLGAFSGVSGGDATFTAPTGWVKPFAARTLQESDGDISGFTATTGGLAVGFDAKFTEDLMLGVSAAYSRSNVQSRHGVDAKIRGDNWQGQVYANYDITPSTYVSLMAGGGISDNHSKRKVTFGGLSDTASADFDGWNATAALEVGHRIALSEDLTLIPRAHAQYIYAEFDDYREDGLGGADFIVDESDADSLELGLSGGFAYRLFDGFHVSGDLGFTYDALAGGNDVTSRFAANNGAGGGTFTTDGLDTDEFAVVGGLGVSFLDGEGYDVSLDYDIAKRQDFTNHQVQVNVKVPF